MNVTRIKPTGIRHALAKGPWAILPDRLDAMVEQLEAAARNGGIPVEQLAARAAERAKGTARVQGAIAVLPLHGYLEQRYNWMMDYFGGTSTEMFGQAFDAMANNPDIGAIIIDCDSPGGTVAGSPELAKRIFAARGKKPIIAIANTCMCSAAYWVASAADEVVASPSAEAIGSIGVFYLHIESSKALEEAGVTATIIRAPEHKGEGTQFEPLSEDALAHYQSAVDELYGLFAKAVSKHRGITVDEVRTKYGAGRALTAKQALAAGMVDRVATLDDVIAKLGGGKPVAIARSRAVADVPAMAATAGTHAGGGLDALKMLTDYEAVEQAAMSRLTPPASEAATVASDPSASHVNRPPTAKENSVHTTTAAQPGAGTESASVENILAAERKRASDIRALCRQEAVTEAFADELVNSGASYEGAAARLLKERKQHLANAPQISVGGDRAHEKPFASLGENLMAIAAFGQGKADAETVGRLNFQAAVSSGGASANVGSDGGFAIQKEFSTELLESTIANNELLKDCDTHEVGPNADGLEVMYLDETSRATGSRWGGVQVYRGAEADSATAKKPKFGKWEVRLEDIIGAAYVTERLLQDAASIQNVFETGFAEEFTFTVVDEIVRANGTGRCSGVLSASDLLVSVAAEDGQEADTIVAENIMKMWKCVPPRSRMKGKWYYNTECDPQLHSMSIGVGTGGQLVYMPPGGLSGSPYGSIYGRPVVPIEQASGLGDVGDIFFGDFSRYKLITKGGLQSENSIHVRFLNNERTFRWIMRVNGAPKDKKSITPYKRTDSNYKLSPFVAIAAR